jgi:TolB-like protein/Tfp pilus assembly protein PilF
MEGGRRLAAIMFTDMVGYTALGQRDESLSLALLEANRKMLRPIFARHNGREIKTIGDAFLVEFASALDAVRCAYDIQRASREFNISLPNEKRIHLRIGIHLGDVVEAQGDILGDAVNVASRIQHLAGDGGVCLTQQVFDHVQSKFELSLVSLGKQALKNVRAPIEAYRIVMPWEAGVERETLDRKRVAVLPFYNMSPNPEDDYFADGMTEELITTLSKIGEISVISRTSVMQYRKAPKHVKDVGKELDAGTILEGSVRKAGNMVRITVQMVDAGKDKHLWAESYDRNLHDIFAIQTDIAKRVADALRVNILAGEKEQIEKKPTISTEAYTLYLKGRHYWNERSKEGVTKAIEYFKQALKLDPNYALGYSGLADCHLILAQWGFEDPSANLQKAETLVTKALELDKNLAEAHAALAAIFFYYEYDQVRAEEEFRRAIELRPNYSTGHQWYHLFLMGHGRWEESYAEIVKALELDPFSLIMNDNLGFYFFARKDYERAMEQSKKVLEMKPDFTSAHWTLMSAQLLASKYDEAQEEAMMISRLSNSMLAGKQALALVFAKIGKAEEARRLLAELEERPKEEEYVSPSRIALILFVLGEVDRGFEWLEKAYEGHDGNLPFLRANPLYDSVKSDPRYHSILKRMGLGEDVQA